MALHLLSISVKVNSVLEAVHTCPVMVVVSFFQVDTRRLYPWKSIGNMAGYPNT